MSLDIAEYADRLLRTSGIEKVVSIDDDYSVDNYKVSVLAALNAADNSVLTELVGPLLSIESADIDLIRDRVRNNWGDFSKELQKALVDRLVRSREPATEDAALVDDVRFASILPEIFGAKLEMLTLKAWEDRRDSLVYESMPPTLLLVDLSFTDEQRGPEEGLRVIAGLLDRHPEKQIYCALLSSHYSIASVHSDWKRIADENKLSQERFVLIPKDSLRTDQRNFLSLIKLAVMNRDAKVLRNAVRRAYAGCLEQVDAELSRLDVYEFERIVCLSSSIEGVWEPDTLLRIFSLYHKKFVRRTLRGDGEIYQAADHLRRLTSIPVGEWGGPTSMEIALRRLEWFEGASDVNEQHLPIELGDLFEIASKPNKLFVLVAQPCDLMMRQVGERHQTVENVILLEASPLSDETGEGDQSEEVHGGTSEETQEADDSKDTKEKEKVPDAGMAFRLDFYEDERDWRISLRKVHYVSLDVLDLCVFSGDGRASISSAATVPNYMSAAWRARFPKLSKKMKKIVSRYAELMKIKNLKQADVLKIVANVSLGNLLQVEIDPRTSSTSFDIRRVGRIKQPRSGALLARYANALARDAFEHDLTRRPVAKSSFQESEPQRAAEIPQQTSRDEKQVESTESSDVAAEAQTPPIDGLSTDSDAKPVQHT